MSEPDLTIERRVWKFPLGTTQTTEILMPQAAKCVLFEMQGDQFTAWFEVNPNSPTIERRLAIVGTGWVVPRGWIHLASFQQDGYVWHLYTERDG